MAWCGQTQLACSAAHAFFEVDFGGGEGFKLNCFVGANEDAFVASDAFLNIVDGFA